MTQGMKSSEFLTALLPMVLGVVLVVIGALKAQQNLLDTGMWLLLGGTGTYGVSRGLAKLGTAPTQPLPADAKAAADVVSKL